MKMTQKRGYSTCQDSLNAAIGGGEANRVYDNSVNNYIGGGKGNSISLPAAMVGLGGTSVIAGGECNKIPTGSFNVIMGGSFNVLTGNHNAILGGNGNCDCGFNCVGIYGFGICANRDCTFYAENYNVSGMLGFAPLTPGQLYYCLIGSTCPVFIV